MNPSLTSSKRIEVCGVPVDCLTMSDTVRAVDEWVAAKSAARTILAVNPEKVIRAQQDPMLMQTLRAGGLLIPDGIGVVLAARLLRLGSMERVPGSDLMPALCELAARRGYGIFMYGASPEVNERAAASLLARFPGLRIAGRQHGFVRQEEMPALVQTINDSGADILFIALGSPRQELWMKEYLPQLNVRACQGVGGTFDVLAGHVNRAPRWAIRANAEWLYRLLSQPSRILRQTALPKFAVQVLRAALMGSR